MAIKSLYALLQLLLLISATFNGTAPSNDAQAQSDAAFARVKSLAGEWQSVGPRGERTKLTYQVISGGTTVMERFSSDALLPNSGEMITMYYIERGQLALTHYCIAHNQPHLRATRYEAQSANWTSILSTEATCPQGAKDICIASSSISSTMIISLVNGSSWRPDCRSPSWCRCSRG